MIDELLTTLRYKSEGTDIDFKSCQYRFIGGNEKDKAEMLKDILAIANAWRDGPGYILLGFKDQRPYPAEVVGISETIDDAKIQQFVHSKVKPKLTFKYEEHLYQGKNVGIITIPKQKRAFYLEHDYGKLRSNVVYVRRGSTTDEAEPPEIAAMTMADAKRGELRVELAILAPNNDELNSIFPLEYLQFSDPIPDYTSPPTEVSPFAFRISAPSFWRDNKNFWREYAEYVRTQSALIEMKFVLHNRSEVPLSNAKLEVLVESLNNQDFQIMSGADLPPEPSSQWNALRDIQTLPQILDRRAAQINVDNAGPSLICHLRFGSLLPGEDGRSTDTIAIVPRGPGKLRLHLRILAGELSAPQESERVLDATGDVKVLDADDLEEMWGKSLLAKHQSAAK